MGQTQTVAGQRVGIEGEITVKKLPRLGQLQLEYGGESWRLRQTGPDGLEAEPLHGPAVELSEWVEEVLVLMDPTASVSLA